MITWRSDELHGIADAASWCLCEARKGTNSIGFIPRPRFIRDFERGRVYCTEENGDLVAYLLRGPLRNTTVVTQMWTRQDARRVLFAAATVVRMLQDCEAAGVAVVRLKCALDLEATKFWPMVGFNLVAQKAGGRSRGRLVGVYERRLLPTLFAFGSEP